MGPVYPASLLLGDSPVFLKGSALGQQLWGTVTAEGISLTAL